MKLRNLVSKRYKETPADCQIASQALMMRGGYIKPVGNGIYTLFPVTKRITNKIERIMREEMDRIGGQEVLFPVVLPGSLWEESGRFDSVADELLRFTDKTVEEIGQDCGFPDANYFARSFKKSRALPQRTTADSGKCRTRNLSAIQKHPGAGAHRLCIRSRDVFEKSQAATLTSRRLLKLFTCRRVPC